jgi:hypothetical protein
MVTKQRSIQLIKIKGKSTIFQTINKDVLKNVSKSEKDCLK